MRQSITLSVSAAAKKKTPRQKFYSALMTRLAGDLGTDLAKSFVEGDVEAFSSGLTSLSKALTDQCRANGKGV